MRRRRRRRRRRRWKVSTTHKKAYTIRRRNSIMQIPRSDCFFTLFVSPHRNGINQFLSSLTAAAAAAAAAEKLVILPFYSNFCVFDLNFRHFFSFFLPVMDDVPAAATTSLWTCFMCSIKASLPRKSLWHREQHVVLGPPIRAAC